MRIAVIGAGFSGLATAYFLSKSNNVSVDLFDKKGLGAGASGASAGLLHCFVGAHSKLNWRAYEAFGITQELIAIAEHALKENVAITQGMLRPAVTSKQKEDFQTCAEKHPQEASWMSPEECLGLYPLLVPHPGLFIKNTVTIQSEKYLKGLFLACQSQGVNWIVEQINSLAALNAYHAIVIATGANTPSIKELSHIPFQLFKGQALQLRWPAGIPPLPFPINSQAYLLMNPDGKSCTAGATYERSYTDALPDIERAMEEILPKVNAFIPLFTQDDVIACKSGIRANTPSKRPMAEKLNDKTWILAGLGAKGLLYHGLLAKELATHILKP